MFTCDINVVKVPHFELLCVLCTWSRLYSRLSNCSKQADLTTYIYTFPQMKRFFVFAMSNGTAIISTSETHMKTSNTLYKIPFSLWHHVAIFEYHFSYSSVLLSWSCTFHTGLCNTRRIYNDTFLQHRESQSGNLDHNKEAGTHLFHSWCCCKDVLVFPELLS